MFELISARAKWGDHVPFDARWLAVHCQRRAAASFGKKCGRRCLLTRRHAGSVHGLPISQAMLPILAKAVTVPSMSTMNVSLPDDLQAFVDAQVTECGYGTNSDFLRELIRRDRDRLRLRDLLLAGAASALGAPADADYFEGLRADVPDRLKVRARG